MRPVQARTHEQRLTPTARVRFPQTPATRFGVPTREAAALDSYRFGAFELLPARRALLRNGDPVAIGSRAFDLLLALVERHGQPISKSELLDRVWAGRVVEEANVQVQVSGLRKLLGTDAIATIPGLGYQFTTAVASPIGDTDPAATAPAGAARDEGRPVPGLPVYTDELVGRDSDVHTLGQWLAQSRLVTVLGPGGIGKTRVAREVVRREADSQSRLVTWVDLSPITSSEHLVAAIANASNLQLGDGHGSAIDLLLRVMRAREMLVVLDNCEHLVADVGRIAHAILSAAPRIQLLVTSQVRLKIPQERVYRLDSLPVPPPGTPLEGLRHFASALLLEQRARLADRRFSFTAANSSAVIGLLRHLDGLPLAIEMAASRLPFMGPRALDALLSEWLRLLRGASHGVASRHQTLRATLDWSHSLLAPEEQAVLRRLSTFAGSFRMDTAQRVATAATLDEYAVLEGLATLVDKSLVQLERLDPPRYRLLETMRIYAAERLAQHAEEAVTAERHRQAMAVLASEIESRFWEMGDRPWLEAYAPEYDDLQAAFDASCACADATVAALTGNALRRLDHLRNVNAPHRRRAEALFGLLDGADPQARSWIWSCLASHGLIATEVVSRLEAARQAVASLRDLHDAKRLHFALCFYAAECSRARDFAGADAALAEAQAIEDPAWPVRRRMSRISAWAGVCIHRGDATGYRVAGRMELDMAEQANADRAAAWARLKLADAALMADDLQEAIELGRSAVIQLRQLDQPSNLGLALSNLCAALLLNGQRAEALAAAAQALPLMWDNGWGYLLLDSLALLAVQDGRANDAALLLGYVDAWYAAHADERQPNEARLAEQARSAAEAVLGAQPLAQMRNAGARLTDAQAESVAARGLPSLTRARNDS